ncbi:MAG: hypothetical protein WAT12_09280 [Candidatus Nitrotoga sp.]
MKFQINDTVERWFYDPLTGKLVFVLIGLILIAVVDRGRNSFRHPALRTVRAVLPHTALQLAVSTSGLACQIDMGFV